jgi:UrcA family protein
MSTNNTFRAIAFGALTALAVGATAHASDVTTTATGVRKTVINYSDLDLSRASDVRELYSRLQYAADQVCQQYSSSSDLRMQRLYRGCYQGALIRAVNSIDHDAVTAMLTQDRRIRLAVRNGKAGSST